MTQIAYARAGIITPEMEYVAIRENLGRETPQGALVRDGENFGAAHSRSTSRRNSCATKSRAGGPIIPANINHPECRADDHRPRISW